MLCRATRPARARYCDDLGGSPLLSIESEIVCGEILDGSLSNPYAEDRSLAITDLLAHKIGTLNLLTLSTVFCILLSDAVV
jgi:hypothetical protein